MVRDRFDGPTKNAILGPFLGPDKTLFLILIFFARVLLQNCVFWYKYQQITDFIYRPVLQVRRFLSFSDAGHQCSSPQTDILRRGFCFWHIKHQYLHLITPDCSICTRTSGCWRPGKPAFSGRCRLIFARDHHQCRKWIVYSSPILESHRRSPKGPCSIRYTSI